ncbi:CGNR zinc finger domain-containing protein [Marinactinospora rubrisoli]|uniref:CGNR zinc finger domain-containing protein n=1 Tax=Marinactinospora rubrisoli TaxID=2715399 RepID=UPI0036D21627
MATALVSTSPVVRRRTGEALPDPVALARFLAEHGVHPDALAGGRPPTGTDLDQTYALRREIRDILASGTEEEAVAGANALVTRAGTGPVLAPDADGGWRWCVTTAPGATLADELAVFTGTGLLGVLRALGHDRFRRCASPVCDGLFADTSRAGRRRYCMPERCGNRVNVANHRARRTRTGR